MERNKLQYVKNIQIYKIRWSKIELIRKNKIY